MNATVLERREALPAPAAVRAGTFRPRRVLAAAGVALLLGAGSWYGHRWWTVGRFLESTDDAFVGGDIVAVAPRVAGLVARVAVVDNQAVHAGDLLVQLDDRDYRAALARAEGAVAAAEAALANLDATRRLQEAVVDEARAGVAAAEAEGERARADAERYRALAQSSFASAQRQQQADADDRKAAADEAKARAALAAAERRVEVIDTQKRQAPAALQQASAERDLARIDLGYTEIRAPVDGAVGNRGVREGAYAAAGAQLLSLVPARGLWVDANFKESQLAAHAPRPAGDGGRRRAAGRDLRRPRRQPRARDRGPVQRASRPRTRPATSPGSCSACRCASCSTATARRLGRLRPGLSVTATVDLREPGRGLTAMGAEPAELSPRAQGLRLRGDVRRLLHRAARHPDRQLVAAGHRRRPLGQPGRDRLGADQLPDRRDHRHPALRLAVAGDVHPLAVLRLGRRLHRRPACSAAGPGTSRA